MDKWVKRENEPLISRLISIGMLLKKLYIFMSRSYCKLQKLNLQTGCYYCSFS